MLIVLTIILLVVVVIVAIKTKSELSQPDRQTPIADKALSPTEQQLQQLNEIRAQSGADKPLTQAKIQEQTAEIEKMRQDQNQKPLTPEENQAQVKALEQLKQSN